MASQFAGAVAGVVLAHSMFGLALMQRSAHERGSFGEALGEVVATFGLVMVIRLCSRASAAHLPAAVALWITTAYWFTSSTSFANPAVTFARSLTDTFAGIAPNHVAGFIGSQLIGAVAGIVCARWISPRD
jgi:glycerol uptake facilitator-like aquaporin